jgi:hypothetical protein
VIVVNQHHLAQSPIHSKSARGAKNRLLIAQTWCLRYRGLHLQGPGDVERERATRLRMPGGKVIELCRLFASLRQAGALARAQYGT